MYGVVRRYTGASALNEAMAQSVQEIEELLTSVPGFVAYYAIRSGDSLATITICQDQEGTQESTRRAANWVRQRNLSTQPPEITEGEVFLRFG